MFRRAHDPSGERGPRPFLALHPFARKLHVAALAIAFALGSLATLAGCGNGIAPLSTSQATPAAPTASAFGPQLGFLWIASDRSLRPILGIPGASQIGESVVPAGTYLAAVASATGKVALLQATDGSLVLTSDLLSLPRTSPVSLGLTLPAGAKLRLSPSATAALAFTPGTTSAALITGLPSSPKLQTVTAPEVIADAAVSDTGSVALESGPSLSVVALSGNPVTLATIGAPGGLSFLPGSIASHDDLLFADAAANTLTLIRSTTSRPARQDVFTSGLLQVPSAVGVSHSGRWALIANSGGQSVVRVDLASLVVVSIACACQPTLAEPLADDGAFRVTSLSSGPNWLVNAAATNPLTLFIPALPSSPSPAVVASAVRP